MVSKKTYTLKSSLLSHILVAHANVKMNAKLEKTHNNAKQTIEQTQNTQQEQQSTTNQQQNHCLRMYSSLSHTSSLFVKYSLNSEKISFQQTNTHEFL